LKNKSFFLSYGKNTVNVDVPNTNRVNRHIEVYRLIKEYVEITNDYEKASDVTKKALEPRLRELEKEITGKYFIFTKNEIKWMFDRDENK
jgi:hypothetical protein